MTKPKYIAKAEHDYPMFLGQRHVVRIFRNGIEVCDPIILGSVDAYNKAENNKTAKKANELADVLNHGFGAMK